MEFPKNLVSEAVEEIHKSAPPGAPTNTEQSMNRLNGLYKLVGGTPNAIEASESAGQQELVRGKVLPTDIQTVFIGQDRLPGKPFLENTGVKFLGFVDNDALFQYVELPPGWKLEATDHAVWSSLLDEKGRERAGIFYKAAFYDRKATLHLKCRYAVTTERVGDTYVCNVKDGEKILFGAVAQEIADGSERKKCIKWLSEHFPRWEDPGAYWDRA